MYIGIHCTMLGILQLHYCNIYYHYEEVLQIEPLCWDYRMYEDALLKLLCVCVSIHVPLRLSITTHVNKVKQVSYS